MQKTIFKFGCPAAFLLVCITLADFYVSAKPDKLTEAFAKIAYRVKSQSEESPTDWEKEQFQMLSKRLYRVKRTTAHKSNRQLFPRFEVVEEIYADEEKAVARFRRIREKPPNLNIERREYWMVNGFRAGEKVYFISTDAVIFYEGLGELTQKLEDALER